MNKSEFIRSFPSDMPAKEVVRLGKKKSLLFSENLVNQVRYHQRQEIKKTKPGPAKTAPKKHSKKSFVPGEGGAVATVSVDKALANLGSKGPRERLLRMLILEAGIEAILKTIDDIKESTLSETEQAVASTRYDN